MNAVSSEELVQRSDEIDESGGDGPWMKIDSCLSVEVFTQAALIFRWTGRLSRLDCPSSSMTTAGSGSKSLRSSALPQFAW